MKVELISYTPDALNLLLGTKGTRLGHHENVAEWSAEKKAEHLAYMRDTIKSSWEFVDYVFEISRVTRALTHQLVRTRTGAYAQESQRTVDVRDNLVMMPEAIAMKAGAMRRWMGTVNLLKKSYQYFIDAEKIPVQDARGILPTNLTTSIKAKFNLRTLHEMAKVRLCTRTQGEYQDVFREMRRLVIEVHPWVGEHQFLEVACVADARCAFPRFGQKECKFYRSWMHVHPHTRAAHRSEFWGAEQQVAIPIARDGKTM